MTPSRRSSDRPETASSDPRRQRFPKGVYSAMILAALLPAGYYAYDSIKKQINPDDRTPGEMARDTLELRRIVSSEKTGEVTETMVDKKGEEAACLLRLMGFWDENNEVVKAPAGVGHSYRENLFHHVNDQYWSAHANKTWQMARSGHWENQLGWLYEDFKSKNPLPAGLKGKEATKWEAEAWEKYFTEYMAGQILECPRWKDGDCMKTWEGLTLEDLRKLREAQKKGDEAAVKAIRSKARDCLLISDHAQSVTRANWLMHADGKGEIEPMTCYRNNLHQALLAVSISAEGGCKLVSKPDGDVNNPGASAHILGSAMDVANREAAEPYLSITGGWQCAFVGAKFGAIDRFMGWGNDLDHCSIGERGVSDEAILYKEKTEAKILTGKAGDIIKEELRKWAGRRGIFKR